MTPRDDINREIYNATAGRACARINASAHHNVVGALFQPYGPTEDGVRLSTDALTLVVEIMPYDKKRP